MTVRTILTQPLICKAEDLYPSGGYERGPRNSFYCFGHFKNVYDDDDDGDGARHSRQDGHVERRQWHANYCRKTVVS